MSVSLQLKFAPLHPLVESMPSSSVLLLFQNRLPAICTLSSALLGAGMPLYVPGVCAGATNNSAELDVVGGFTMRLL